MRGKSVWLLVLCFVPATGTAAAVSRGFRMFSAGCFLLYTLLLIAALIFTWVRFVDRPAEDFLAAITRALSGDYRARFSCFDGNCIFKKLSYGFNNFMSCVENQTEELMENRRVQNQLYEDEKVYRSALELTCERVFEADLTHNRLLYGQVNYQKTFPDFHTELFDEMVRFISQNAVAEDDAEKFFHTFSRSALLKTFRASGKHELTLDYRQKKADGASYWVGTTVVCLNGNADGSLKVIGFVKNIDERKRQELEILKQSQKDGLTGLYHKKFTQALIEHFLQDEGRGSRHAVIMVDIDNFKRINDSFGHLQGDAALVSVAQKMQTLFRSTDVVGRVGGDEFLILMKNYTTAETLLEKLEAMSKVFGEIRLADGSINVSGSIGAAVYPEDGTCFTDLYQKADIALYFSKTHGKNRYCLYDYSCARQSEIPADSLSRKTPAQTIAKR